jgi:mannose-1-phosphate guanylyltransferase/mannose-6-phosphate isomerase
MKIIPVILAGGSGTRLWPAARENSPKQFQSFGSPTSMLAETLARLSGDLRFAAPMVCSGMHQRDALGQELDRFEHGVIVLEPVKRNTAPAIAAAALIAQKEFGGNVVIAVMPSDHSVDNAAAFRDTIADAAGVASTGPLTIVAVKPDHPATGLGYVELGEQKGAAISVKRFIEKPDLKSAERFVADDKFAWNAGILVARADVFLAEMATHCAEVLRFAQKAVERAEHREGQWLLDLESYQSAPAISVDYALLETSDCVSAVRARFVWSDLGSWRDVWSSLQHDSDGNAIEGTAVLDGCTNTYVRSDNGIIAAVGLEKMIVVQSGGITMIAPMHRAQDVGKLAERVAAEAKKGDRVYRPWGYMDYLQSGAGFQVKRLVVTPGNATSLQSHSSRAEHMTVVVGTARIERDGEVHTLSAGQSIDIARGSRHRLACQGNEPCQIIEVWLGDTLTEDDIVRYEDRYGRI